MTEQADNDVKINPSAEEFHEIDPFGDEKSDHQRESWGSKIGLILAMAGNAIGLGNFLRFPCKAASNGGGAFMIPYFIALVLLGIPLMWVEWALGRLGGKHGHGTLPSVFDKIWKNPVSKYLGALGVVLPLLIVIYYNYIESWTLAYGYFSITGKYDGIRNRDAMETFLAGYTGQTSHKEIITPSNSSSEIKLSKEITVPLKKYYGDGIYSAGYEFILQSGKTVSGRTEFAVYKSASKSMQLPSKSDPLPPEIVSITPGPGELSAKEIGELKFLFNSDVKTDDYKLTMNWSNNYFTGYKTAIIFFLIALAINMLVLYKGVESGIEALAKIAMPTLFIFAIILAIRVLTLDAIKASPIEGLGFIWNPDFSMLTDAKIWLAAAGQIFFTLSVCMGAIQTYASFLKDSDDIVLTGLTTAATNEFAEVILGGSIAIPASVVFFGAAETSEIAKSGAFNLGFCSMPIIFQQIPLGNILGAMWFGLLFFAGITSSVALAYPAIVFLKDELKYSHNKAVSAIGVIMLFCSLPVIFYFEKGFLDEMDFWAGTFGLVLFGFIELIYFGWIFGMDNAWAEMHLGHAIKIPRFFYYVIKYVTPLFIFTLMAVWGYQDGIANLTMKNVPAENVPILWLARLMMAAFMIGFSILIKRAWDKKRTVNA